jgi:hypothetical protein
VPGRLTAMPATRQRWPDARLEHSRRRLLARTVTDAIGQATAALAAAVRSGDPRTEVWRMAAARTSELLAMLCGGAGSLGQPPPAGARELVHELRVWAVTLQATSAEAERAGSADPPRRPCMGSVPGSAHPRAAPRDDPCSRRPG